MRLNHGLRWRPAPRTGPSTTSGCFLGPGFEPFAQRSDIYRRSFRAPLIRDPGPRPYQDSGSNR